MLRVFPIDGVYRIAVILKLAVERCTALLAIQAGAAALSSSNYHGFDERDIADYNLDKSDYNNDSELETKKQEANQAFMQCSIWLLLLTQLFGPDYDELSICIRSYRVNYLGFHNIAVAKDDSTASTVVDDTIKLLAASTKSLLLLSSNMKEEAYLLCIKAITYINSHFPSKDLIGSTEVRS